MEKQTRPLPPSPPPTPPLTPPFSFAPHLCPSPLPGDNLKTSSAAPQVDDKTVCVRVGRGGGDYQQTFRENGRRGAGRKGGGGIQERVRWVKNRGRVLHREGRSAVGRKVWRGK